MNSLKLPNKLIKRQNKIRIVRKHALWSSYGESCRQISKCGVGGSVFMLYIKPANISISVHIIFDTTGINLLWQYLFVVI